jgi:hypothetical protein
MNEGMASGSVRLKGRELLRRFGTSMYSLEKSGAASYPTIHKYITRPEEVDYISAEVLYGILVDGLGLSPEDVANMRFGEIFELVPANGGIAAE